MLILFAGCESFYGYSCYDRPSSPVIITAEDISDPIEVIPQPSPAEIDKSMSASVKDPIQTSHKGTITDPIHVGEYGEWSFWQQEADSFRKHYYDIRMNVNYSIRGTEALRLYNEFNYDPDDYFYEDYRPTNGYELAIINISVQIKSKDTVPASLSPLSFMLSTASGLGVSTNDPQVAYQRYLRYYNLFAGNVHPGAKITANLVYEVPVNQDILIGLTDVWFEIAE